VIKFREVMHLDRKGVGLLLIGITWFLLGIGIYDEDHHIDAWHTHIYDPIRIAMWCTAGTVAIASAWLHQARPWAMGLLVISPGIRFFSWMTAWIVYLIPDGDGNGAPLGWASAAVNLAMIGFVFYVASDDGHSGDFEKVNRALLRDDDGS
jgi:hypothetical protein